MGGSQKTDKNGSIEFISEDTHTHTPIYTTYTYNKVVSMCVRVHVVKVEWQYESSKVSQKRKASLF